MNWALERLPWQVIRLGSRDGEIELLDQTLELPRALCREAGVVSLRVTPGSGAGDDEGHDRGERPMRRAARRDGLEVRAELRRASRERTTFGERRRVGGDEHEAAELVRQPYREPGRGVTNPSTSTPSS